METRDGTLPVSVYGDWLPRTLFGYFHAVCAYIRMLYLALCMVMVDRFDVVVCDQVSACIPILRAFSKAKILFYCHFPDQLLAPRHSRLKALYRAPIDWLEERTTGCADVVLVNSKFTQRVFEQTFRSLSITPSVLYPSLHFSAFDADYKGQLPVQTAAKFVFLSINRFERKKNVLLAVEALQELRGLLAASRAAPFSDVHLVMAGGYDPRVAENVEYFQELEEAVAGEKLHSSVSFVRSFSDADKVGLLRRCTALLYTPANEHFGITPLEAMYLSRPVIAVASGGPLETMVGSGPQQTGFLCEQHPLAFAEAMHQLIVDPVLVQRLGAAGRARVVSHFSFDAFASSLNHTIQQLAGR